MSGKTRVQFGPPGAMAFLARFVPLRVINEYPRPDGYICDLWQVAQTSRWRQAFVSRHTAPYARIAAFGFCRPQHGFGPLLVQLRLHAHSQNVQLV
jgi:hypothetical protein